MDVLCIPQLDEIGTGGEGEGGGSGSGGGSGGTAARYRILRRVPEDGTVKSEVIKTGQATRRASVSSASASNRPPEHVR